MENTIHLDSDLEKDIQAAQKAVNYFAAMLQAHKAMGELIQYQKDDAQKTLDKFTQKLNSNEN